MDSTPAAVCLDAVKPQKSQSVDGERVRDAVSDMTGCGYICD